MNVKYFLRWLEIAAPLLLAAFILCLIVAKVASK